LALVLVLSSCAHTETFDPSSPTKHLKKSIDKMTGYTWYQSRATDIDFYLYFGRNDVGNLLPIHLRITHISSRNPLFIKNVWARADGERIEIPQDKTWESKVISRSLLERSDEALDTPSEKLAVHKLMSAEVAIIRYEGRNGVVDKEL